jgi:general secretion pathway protein H
MTSRSDRNGQRGNRITGFTLVELLVVLVILGLIAGLFLRYPLQRSRTLDLRAAAGQLAAGMRLARAQAIAGNQPVAVVLDLAARSYAIGDARAQSLPHGLSIELLTVASERTDARRADIRFNPDGSSTGGRVSLADGHDRIAVGVDWLTGRVTVADVR